ncbi:MAG: adenosylcobinamide-GDP ribazoletransferase [Pseudomonadota bacterium]
MAHDTASKGETAGLRRKEGLAILSALQFATRLPLPDPGWEAGRMTRAAPWLPLAGVIAGSIAATVLLMAALVLPMPVAAGLALASLLALTGALHEDGFADLADAAGAWASRERALEIMRDSRNGTFAVLALILLIGLRWQALAGLTPHAASIALIAAAALGRMAMLAVMRHPGPARANGLAAGLLSADGDEEIARRLPRRLALSIIVVVSAAVLLLGHGGVAAALAALVAAVAVAVIAHRRLGGHTGDSLGAAAAAGETAALLALVVWSPSWSPVGPG